MGPRIGYYRSFLTSGTSNLSGVTKVTMVTWLQVLVSGSTPNPLNFKPETHCDPLVVLRVSVVILFPGIYSAIPLPQSEILPPSGGKVEYIE